MPRRTMIEAIRDAMDVMMGRDDNVVVFGEDVGFFGGVFRCTQGLQAKYGKSRCFDAPINESGIVGAAVGMAAYGLRPCVEIQFADYMYPAYDQIVSEAARLRYRSNGQFTCPLVVRMPTGGGISGGQTHSQSPEALFTHVSGLKTVVPSTPGDAKGLLIAAIEDPDPVIFLEPKRLYNGPFDGHYNRPVTPWSKHEFGEVPDGHYSVPLGKAAIRRPGAAVTILAYGTMVYVGLTAAAETSIDAEIIDLRTLVPLDLETIETSVRKTGRCVIIHEATHTSGFGAELAALVQENCFYHLEKPIKRVTGWDTPYPHAQEWDYFPGPDRVGRALLETMSSKMAERAIRLPDVGEGVAEAELVEWHVKIGDLIGEDDILAAVMTDKATVEIPSPIAGEIVWLAAEVGDVVAVGSDLVRVNVGSKADNAVVGGVPAAKAKPPAAEAVASAPPRNAPVGASLERAPVVAAPAVSTPDRPNRIDAFRHFAGGAPRPEGEKPLASPAVRLRAREAGVDLRQVPGTGPAGRISHEDLDALFAQGPASIPSVQPRTAVEDIKIVGLRRKIAERMAIANTRIPHITYVEEVDVTGLEELRATLNKDKHHAPLRLTLLPFLMRAMVKAIAEQPNLNALFDDEAGVLHQHAAVHIGIAAQTQAGLLVPVVRHAEALDLWGCGAELNRLAEAAKQGTATRDELSGSTITITSLGAMGGVVTTPIINHPEVAIIGVNKMMVRPVWDGSAFIPRKMMNLSSSFDHRVVDGFDASRFVQRIKTLLETPALIFMEG